ncbi:MAG: DEAD/DEAH box helicase [Acidobacteria bacterium]|nr:DEAD/DEAH box helicase [Acidobacteriota bacterium]
MSRNTISTGFAHQRDVAVWVRRRLVDSGGGWFDAGTGRVEQYGVVLADGVGLGKTWEALAASALILVERGKQRSGGGRRQNVRKKPARVLVLCPPGLVSKWSREVRDPKGFAAFLKRWAGKRSRRAFVVDTLTKPYEIRLRSNLADIPSGRMRHSRVELPPGTYICNWNVLRRNVGSGRSRLAALRSQSWDVLIVDEAHHREAREAMETVRAWSRHLKAVLLLTATPFQLEPRELHQLFGTILDGRHGAHRVLSRPPVREFVAGVAGFFEGGEPPGAAKKHAAEQSLRQALGRSMVRTPGRRFYIINENGKALEIAPPERLRENQLHTLLPKLIRPGFDFESWYLRRRLRLAEQEKTFIPNALRQALSTPAQAAITHLKPPCSPRLDALVLWAKSQAEVDLMRAARDGYPRKMLVFTSFVAKAAADLERALSTAIDDAWKAARATHLWRRMAGNASGGIAAVIKAIEGILHSNAVLANAQEGIALLEAFQGIKGESNGNIFRDLFGQQRFRKLVISDLERRFAALSAVLCTIKEDRGLLSLRREELRGVRTSIHAIARSSVVETYTGHDDRRDRDAAGEAFRSPLSPWVLVASNVGSEGIDLHTYSEHLIHFDIEWNPARMEQREGRTDRIGRVLRDPVNVYFTLVGDTYDERMLHQLVARQRWHSVLLGRSGAKLARDRDGSIEARFLDQEHVRKLALDLRPNQRAHRR